MKVMGLLRKKVEQNRNIEEHKLYSGERGGDASCQYLTFVG